MVDEITPDELQALREEGEDPTVVDIRSPAAFRQGHIAGSVNVPFPQLATGVAELADADHVVTVCPHGHDSVRAARMILSYEGVDEETPVESLAGGLTAWDGPVEHGVDEQTSGGSVEEGPVDGRGATGDDGDSGGPTAPF